MVFGFVVILSMTKFWSSVSMIIFVQLLGNKRNSDTPVIASVQTRETVGVSAFAPKTWANEGSLL